jgi:hypothetical protein
MEPNQTAYIGVQVHGGFNSNIIYMCSLMENGMVSMVRFDLPAPEAKKVTEQTWNKISRDAVQFNFTNQPSNQALNELSSRNKDILALVKSVAISHNFVDIPEITRELEDENVASSSNDVKRVVSDEGVPTRRLTRNTTSSKLKQVETPKKTPVKSSKQTTPVTPIKSYASRTRIPKTPAKTPVPKFKG